MSQESQVEDQTSWLKYGLNRLNGLKGHIWHENHKFTTKHVDWGTGWMGWMDLRVIYGMKITSSGPNMLIEVRAEWIEGSYMSQKSQVQDKTCWLKYGLNGLNGLKGHIWHKNHKFMTKHVDWGTGWMGWMDWRVIYGIKITSSGQNMLIEVWAEWAEWI